MQEFEVFLQGIVAAPAETIEKLPILPPAERHALVVEWNDTRRHYPEDLCVHQLFERQAERTPHAEALVYAAEPLTHQELNSPTRRMRYDDRDVSCAPSVTVVRCSRVSWVLVAGIMRSLETDW